MIREKIAHSKFSAAAVMAAATLSSVYASSGDLQKLQRRSGHAFTLTNRCGNNIQPVIADTRCGYSPRCDNAVPYSGAQPGTLAPGATETVTIDSAWVGRIFAQNGACGEKGEGCTMLEFNLDTGDQFSAQAYDISNIQGFTQSISVAADGCASATCTNPDCGCANAYPVGDMTGCAGSGPVDQPVKACGPGDIPFSVVFCP